MSEYTATVKWLRGEQIFTDNAYSRAHKWIFDGGLSIPASASPRIVPSPMSVAGNVDPEEAFVAALSSCHMLFFLSLAAAGGFVVDAYSDDATGFLEKNDDGRTAMTKVILRPGATYGGVRLPNREKVEILHRDAHELCFIANSVNTIIVTKIIS